VEPEGKFPPEPKCIIDRKKTPLRNTTRDYFKDGNLF
jgi:hypothetical protein